MRTTTDLPTREEWLAARYDAATAARARLEAAGHDVSIYSRLIPGRETPYRVFDLGTGTWKRIDPADASTMDGLTLADDEPAPTSTSANESPEAVEPPRLTDTPAPTPTVRDSPCWKYENDGQRPGDGTWHRFDPHKSWSVDGEAQAFLRYAERNGMTFDGRAAIDDYLAVMRISHGTDDPIQWDANPVLLGLPDGDVLDLESGDTRPMTANMHITKAAAVAPSNERPALFLDEFLGRVLPDPEMQKLLRTAIAYTLTGHLDEEVSVWCFGPRSSGKSTLNETLQAMLGTYAVPLPDNTVVTRGRGGKAASPATKEWRSDLRAARYASVEEVGRDFTLNERDFKIACSGNPVTERRLYKGYKSFRTSATPWLFGNSLPFMSVAPPILKRIVAVPFSVPLSDSDKDLRLKHRLRRPEELARILGWAAERAAEILAERDAGPAGTSAFAVRPDASTTFVDDMVEDADPIHGFVLRNVEPAGADEWLSMADATSALRKWAAGQDDDVGSHIHRFSPLGLSQKLAAVLREKGGVSCRRMLDGRKVVRGYRRLRLADEMR